jgi:hypothetical protein
MQWAPEIRPSETAPVSGWYNQLDGEGSRTGSTVFIGIGQIAPVEPDGVTWQLRDGLPERAIAR